MDDLRFLLHKTRITIRPAGYLYSLPNARDCFIGIQGLDDKQNHYRLGTVFLRNFYMALDFENNQLGFAQNVDSWADTTEFVGKAPNPYDRSYGLVIFVIAFLSVLTVIALFIYFRSKKLEEERTVVFGHEQSAEKTTRYKNGVEIKPSERA